MLTRRPSGLDELIHTFGDIDDPGFEATQIVPFLLPYPLYYDGTPVTRARCHRLIVDNFQRAFRDIQAAGLQNEVRNYSGIFARRPIRGFGSHPSTHSWGIAIDLEAERYPLGSRERFPQTVVDIFQSAGFFYGGDFLARKDPMHFQFCERY